ncbi:MAG TPA: hypothetical protein ENG83_12930 [Nitrospirae bacterium]|nr:hypothetical protein BMS3Abin06_02665 [bacterium BMS3Abin06]HDH13081.1 hypothetical protein [Nitrospirota bacterium]HDZ02899.1 hypothetical protein [Nitrospirota bacterium]
MSIEIGLLSLESILLVATIILLVYSIKEGKERDKLIMEVGKATKVLTRQEYFLAIIDSMMDAKKEITGCITGRPPTGDDKRMTRDIMENIKRMTKKGVRVRYLMPKFPDRLHLGYLYMKAGAEIQYSSCLMVHNIRFINVDNRIVVIGIPESTGEKEATKKGYRIPSEGLATVLKNYFDTCEKQLSFIDYLKEVINQTGATPEHIAREYQIDEEELKKLAGR